MTGENKILFSEIQKFRQAWIWIIILAIAGVFWYAFITQIFFKIPFGNKSMPDDYLAVFWLVFGIGLPVLFYNIKLITEVRNDGIYIRFFPIHFSFRKIPFDQLKKYEVRTYRPILEYGGWGIRWGFKGKAYNVSGNRGVQLELMNGKRILIGSERPEELFYAIDVSKEKNK